MIVQMAVTSFFVCMLIAAFLDLSSTGRKIFRLTDAMYNRNEAGYWIGFATIVVTGLLAIWYMYPAALLLVPAGMAGMVLYDILSSTLRRLTRKA